MSVVERISKRPKEKSVKLIDLPKPDTGLALKATHKTNAVNYKLNNENLQQHANTNIQLTTQEEEKTNIT